MCYSIASKKLRLALPTGLLQCVQQSQVGFYLLFKPVEFSLEGIIFIFLYKVNFLKNKVGTGHEVILLPV